MQSLRRPRSIPHQSLRLHRPRCWLVDGLAVVSLRRLDRDFCSRGCVCGGCVAAAEAVAAIVLASILVCAADAAGASVAAELAAIAAAAIARGSVACRTQAKGGNIRRCPITGIATATGVRRRHAVVLLGWGCRIGCRRGVSMGR